MMQRLCETQARRTNPQPLVKSERAYRIRLVLGGDQTRPHSLKPDAAVLGGPLGEKICA
jgi:hypothetical protein